MIDIEIPVGKRTKIYRFFEAVPAMMSWSLLLLPFILALVSPVLSAYFVLIYMAQYLLRVAIMAVRAILGYNEMRRRQKYDWKRLIGDLEDPEDALRVLQKEDPSRESLWHYNTLLDYTESDEEWVKPSQLYHAVFVAVYKESLATLRPTLQALADSNYDMSKVIVYLAYEERAGEETAKNAAVLEKEFSNSFFMYESVAHPDGLLNEVIGKGGNITFAARHFYKYVQAQSLNPEHVLVTTLDADNRVHENYLASVAYAYMTTPKRKHYSYQPIPMYLNNIWDTNAPSRMIATGSSFWWAIQSTRPHQLRNFSSHAQPLSALIETDFWSTRTIVEDGHQFWRSYFALDGVHDVVPTFVPIYQDAVLDEGYRSTLRAQFIQLRRWAYGASDIAYVVNQVFVRKSSVPKFDVILKLLRLIESHVSWATAPLILAGSAWAPFLANPNSRQDIVALQLPGIAAFLQSVALLGVPAMIYISFKILPDRPAHYSKNRNIFMMAQWLLVPIISIIYGSSTALNSQTRLFLGKYLDKFDVTKKVVANRND